MEEILASIRRIISDEVASGGREPGSSPGPARDAADGAASDIRSGPPSQRRDLPASEQLAEAAIAAGSGEPTEVDETPAEAVRADRAVAADDEGPAGPVVRQGPVLPAFVSRSAMRAARSEPNGAAGSSGYIPAGRAPAADPFATGRRVAATGLDEPVAAARPEPTFTPAPRPWLARPASGSAAAVALPDYGPVEAPQPFEAPRPVEVQDEVQNQDERFAAALLDLDLVEQAVQAELAIMSSETAEAATAQSAPTQAMVSERLTAGADDSTAVASALSHAEPRQATLPDQSDPETADMQVQAKPAAASRTSAGEPADDRRTENRGEPRFFPRPAEAPAAAEAPNRLVSGTTTTAVSTAFGTLARTVASNSRTVDDLVTEAVRPMLKEWLDENLPALVERLVRAEIERVSRQGL